MHRFSCYLVTVGLALGALACVPASEHPLFQTKTSNGELLGVEEDGVAAYLGVPYAAPPVGDLRWQAPTPAASWEGVREATSFAASCIQKRYGNGIEGSPWTKEYVADPAGEFSEDCLYLNVWTPAVSSAERLPVFYWIYGGGFNQGGTSLPLYNGAEMARKGVIFVSVNYRVGALGLMAHPELTAEAGTSGNYAIEDVIAGLRWVRENIEDFGGDPTQVTIAGQSAGASGVHNLISSPKAKGLFARAIAESGSRPGGAGTTLAEAEADGVAFMKAAGKTSLAELRAMSPDDILAVAAQGVRFRPIVDGVVEPMSQAAAYETGDYNDTPVLTGFTADEGSSSPTYGKETAAEFTAAVKRAYGDLAPQILAEYPAADDAAAGAAAKALARDRNIASMYLWGIERLKTSKSPIYEYLFTHTMPGPDSARFGAFHSVELAYVFNTLDQLAGRNFTEPDRDVADTMIRYWTNFVKTGNPNGADLPQWPPLDRESKQIMELGHQFSPRAALSPEKLALFKQAAAR